MDSTVLGGTPVAFVPAEGPLLTGPQQATDLIGDMYGSDAELIAIPTSRLPADFFDLSTRIAGEVLQKFANYHLRVAVLGDIESHVERSSALRDFVRESNRGRQVWFLPDRTALEAKLS